MDLLTRSKTTTYCPYKGRTVYFSFAGEQDIAWSYEQLNPGMEALTDRLAFSGAQILLSSD